MKTKFTLVNEAGMTLKYVFKDRMVFNGDNPNERSEVIYSVSKKETIEKLLEVAHSYSLKNVKITEISVEKTEKLMKKEKKVSKTEEAIDETTEDLNFNPDYLFENLNKKCLSCKNTCKQSSKTQIVKCPQFVSM